VKNGQARTAADATNLLHDCRRPSHFGEGVRFHRSQGAGNERCGPGSTDETRGSGPGCGHLYAQFCQNYESRYGDEITRLVQGALDDLAYSNTASKETMKLGSSITERLRLLHEQSGIPVLNIKSSRTTSSRSRVTTR
jgi:hypothetical protein